MMPDELIMSRCLQLALAGGGFVHPNPLVGSVIVHNETIIGEGYHQKYGSAHAEVNAIRSVKDARLLSRSRLFVSLEPCSHHGKTPPCSDLIIHSGIPEVVIAVGDPNPAVAGNGIRKLKAAGIRVTEGILKEEARYVNRRFMMFMEHQRPYVILKWAETSDGFIGIKGGKQLISSATSRTLVHQWRSTEHAILVGTATALNDDPLLDTRLWGPPDPVRVVIDMDLKLPKTLRIFRKKGFVMVLNAHKDQTEGHIRYLKVSKGADMIASMMKALHHAGIVSLLVEGGSQTLQSFLQSGIWDECRVFRSPNSTGAGVPAPLHPASVPVIEKVDSDLLFQYFRT